MRIINALVAAAVLATLAACNTVGGVGRDLQSGGAAITDTAQETQSEL